MSDGPVETFLAELGRHLKRDDAARRRVVAEVGDHLRDLVAEGRARGLDELTAELEAVERFGSPRTLARGFRTPSRHARTGWTATALIGAALCGALAFSGLRPGEHGRGVPRAGQTTLVGCIVWLPASAPSGPQQVLAGTRIAIDPRYGSVRRCASPSTTIVFHLTDSAAPPADEAPLHDVSMATAWHQ